MSSEREEWELEDAVDRFLGHQDDLQAFRDQEEDRKVRDAARALQRRRAS